MFLFITHAHVGEIHLESMGFKADCLIVGFGGVHPSDIHSNAPMQ
jgi:hypothetical protein